MALADNSLREVYRGRDVDCTVTGLSPGRPYLFQVRAFNKAGVSRQYILFLSFPSLPLIPYPLLQILTLLPSLPLLSHLLSTLSFPPYFSSVPLPFLHSPPFRLSLSSFLPPSLCFSFLRPPLRPHTLYCLLSSLPTAVSLFPRPFFLASLHPSLYLPLCFPPSPHTLRPSVPLLLLSSLPSFHRTSRYNIVVFMFRLVPGRMCWKQ